MKLKSVEAWGGKVTLKSEWGWEFGVVLQEKNYCQF